MQVISEKDLTPKQAHHFMKRVAKDSFIEENDQQKAKNIALVLSELSLHQDDIVDAPKIEEETKQEEIVEEKKEEIKNEEPVEEKPKRHRRKHSSEAKQE